jgi:hypothetical protein
VALRCVYVICDLYCNVACYPALASVMLLKEMGNPFVVIVRLRPWATFARICLVEKTLYRALIVLVRLHP